MGHLTRLLSRDHGLYLHQRLVREIIEIGNKE